MYNAHIRFGTQLTIPALHTAVVPMYKGGATHDDPSQEVPEGQAQLEPFQTWPPEQVPAQLEPFQVVPEGQTQLEPFQVRPPEHVGMA